MCSLFWYRELQKLLCPALSLLAKNCDFPPPPKLSMLKLRTGWWVMIFHPMWTCPDNSLFLANHSPGWNQERANQKAQLRVWLPGRPAGRKSNRQNRLLRHWNSETTLLHWWQCLLKKRQSCMHIQNKGHATSKESAGKLEVEMARQEQKCCHREQRSRTTWLGQSCLREPVLKFQAFIPSPRTPATVSNLVCANPGAKHWCIGGWGQPALASATYLQPSWGE